MGEHTNVFHRPNRSPSTSVRLLNGFTATKSPTRLASHKSSSSLTTMSRRVSCCLDHALAQFCHGSQRIRALNACCSALDLHQGVDANWVTHLGRNSSLVAIQPTDTACSLPLTNLEEEEKNVSDAASHPSSRN